MLKKSFIYLQVTIILAIIIIVFMNYKSNVLVLNNKILPTILISTSDNGIKYLNKSGRTILYWDTFHGDETMGFGLGTKIFENCTVNSCLITNNKNLMPVEQFDAIIFHGARYKINLNGIPNKRSVQQKYIFFSWESAYNTQFENQVNEEFYNWTLTFKKKSDLYYPYGIIKRKSRKYVAPTNFQKRFKFAAWFASNCKYTKGAELRLNYINELKKHIPIDVYGNCGFLKCPHSPKCYEMLEQEYKFYLSFENSECDDYVTEKLFNVLNYNIIPVVRGSANYSSIAPPNSVINTKDFSGPKELANYLISLDRNETEYLKYFKWKEAYGVEDRKEEMLCDLCRKLHEPLKYSWYRNIKDWYFEDCTSG